MNTTSGIITLKISEWSKIFKITRICHGCSQHSHDTSWQRHTCVIPEAVIQLNAPDDERKYRSKHVEQPRNNKLSYTVASC
jgi:hypothetical protein